MRRWYNRGKLIYQGGEEEDGRCAIEARLRLLRERNTTGSKVVKAAPYFSPKGREGQ
jgi:hypothetical protein